MLTNADLLALDGKPGNFTVKIRQRPRYIDADNCTACGLCWFFCPEVAIAISPGDRENPPAALFDLDHCKGCGQCAEICPRGVIEMEEDL